MTISCGMPLARPHRKSTTARGWMDILIPFGRVHTRAGAVTSTRRWGLLRADFSKVVHLARLVTVQYGSRVSVFLACSPTSAKVGSAAHMSCLVQFCPHTVVDKKLLPHCHQSSAARRRSANHSARHRSFQTVRSLFDQSDND